jgi:hypothetical protein
MASRVAVDAADAAVVVVAAVHAAKAPRVQPAAVLTVAPRAESASMRRTRALAARAGSVPTSNSCPTGMITHTRVDMSVSLTRDTRTVRAVALARVARVHVRRSKRRAQLRVANRTADRLSPANRRRASHVSRRDNPVADTSRVNRAAMRRASPNGVSNTKAAHSARRQRPASLSPAKARHSVNRQAPESWPMGLPGIRRPISQDHRPPRLLGKRRSRLSRMWCGRRHRPTIDAKSNPRVVG